MSNTNVNSGGGIGFFGLLTILFIGLKLTGFITWSWWWVLAPIWIPMLLVFGLLAFFFCVVAAGSGISSKDIKDLLEEAKESFKVWLKE